MWVGAPSGNTAAHDGDLVVVYGTRDAIDRLDRRHAGADGEMDRITSEVEFTERYLAQQEQEQEMEATAPHDVQHRDHQIDET